MDENNSKLIQGPMDVVKFAVAAYVAVQCAQGFIAIGRESKKAVADKIKNRKEK